MSTSILDSTKKALDVPVDLDVFDGQIIMHINTALSTLTQLGVGPSLGYMIEDAAPTWVDFLGDDPRLNPVKSYVYLKVRMLFDPPATSFHLTAINEQMNELVWRINVRVEEANWTPQETIYTPEGYLVDGGSAE